jgi:putative Holliday junction resolvase
VTGDSNVLLAFDFGLRRIGIASGNVLTRTASPLTTLSFKQELPWAELNRLIDAWRPGRLVVGLPNDAGPNSIAASVRTFAQELGHRFELEVNLVDETLTSEASRSYLREGRRSGYLRRRVAKGRLDRHAACLIAEQWLNENRHAD